MSGFLRCLATDDIRKVQNNSNKSIETKTFTDLMSSDFQNGSEKCFFSLIFFKHFRLIRSVNHVYRDPSMLTISFPYHSQTKFNDFT